MTYLDKANNKYILTFGYGNRKNYDTFLDYLKEYDVTCVIDVRLSPRAWSRKWYREQIAKFCALNNIKYISEVSLGNTSCSNKWVPSNCEESSKALLEISKIAQSGTVLLLCAEMNSSQCHRVDVACQLQKLVNTPIKHLK